MSAVRVRNVAGSFESSNGYTIVMVEHQHPCAQPSGHRGRGAKALEHQVVAFEVLGFWDKAWEVHHRDEDRTHNDPENLIVFFRKANHTALHNMFRGGKTEAEALAEIGTHAYAMLADYLGQS
jgi:hypothetical protein